MGVGGAVKHSVGSHWVMGSKWWGVVGAGVGDIMREGSRSLMRWASDCHRQLPHWRHLAYVFREKGIGEVVRGIH
jgi:hypothetical protein